jgi:adenylate cyclase class IV
MAYKHRIEAKTDDGATDDKGMEEYTVVTSNFEETCTILRKIGLIDKFHEEKRRIKYIYKDINFDIDTQPGIPPFLEIEASSWKKVDEGIKLLELNPQDKRITSAGQIYKMHGIDMLDYKEFSFDKGLVKK